MKRMTILVTILIMSLSLASCGTTGSQPDVSPGETGTETEQPPNEEASEQEKVTVYYVNEQATDLVGEERDLEYETPEQKYEEVMLLLQDPREDGHYSLWEAFQYHTITLQANTLVIDASGENTYTFGGGIEAMAFDAFTRTFFQFPEVEQIQFTVDGEIVEAMMGHIDTREPFVREESR
ncbi:MAG: GerMN domain-containing protein [Bacillaceae bacterium]|nr:GerMN domain-containing protein [Bacillaceae bacterium]